MANKINFLALDDERAFRILAGRSRYNNAQKRAREARKLKMVRLIASGQYKPSETTALGEALGVSRVSVHSYIKEIENGPGARCVRCGQLLPLPPGFSTEE